jgi:hypothetical protein
MATLPIMFAPKLMLQLRGQARRGGRGVPFSVVNRSDSGRPQQRRSVSSFLSSVTKNRPDDDNEDNDAASSSLFHSSDQKKILRKCRDLHASIMDLNERVSFFLCEGCGDQLVRRQTTTAQRPASLWFVCSAFSLVVSGSRVLNTECNHRRRHIQPTLHSSIHSLTCFMEQRTRALAVRESRFAVRWRPSRTRAWRCPLSFSWATIVRANRLLSITFLVGMCNYLA